MYIGLLEKMRLFGYPVVDIQSHIAEEICGVVRGRRRQVRRNLPGQQTCIVAGINSRPDLVAVLAFHSLCTNQGEVGLIEYIDLLLQCVLLRPGFCRRRYLQNRPVAIQLEVNGVIEQIFLQGNG